MRLKRSMPLWHGRNRWPFVALAIVSMATTILFVIHDGESLLPMPTPTSLALVATISCLAGVLLAGWLRGWVAAMAVWIVFCLLFIKPIAQLPVLAFFFALAWIFYGTLVVVLIDVIAFLARHAAPSARLP